jgi:hypothetical protein
MYKQTNRDDLRRNEVYQQNQLSSNPEQNSNKKTIFTTQIFPELFNFPNKITEYYPQYIFLSDIYLNNRTKINKLYSFVNNNSDSINENNTIKGSRKLSEFLEIIKNHNATLSNDNINEKIRINSINCGKTLANKDNMINIILNDNLKNWFNEEFIADIDTHYNQICQELNQLIITEMNKKNFENINNQTHYIDFIDFIIQKSVYESIIQSCIYRNMGYKITNLGSGNFKFIPDVKDNMNIVILIENNKLQIHIIQCCEFYKSDQTPNDPDIKFAFHFIFDLIKDTYNVVIYPIYINPKTNILGLKLNNETSNANASNVNTSNAIEQPVKFVDKMSNVISENKTSTAVGTLLTLGALSAIPLALLLGGKRTRRFKGYKQRRAKTHKQRHRQRQRQRKTKNRKYKNKNKTIRH